MSEYDFPWLTGIRVNQLVLGSTQGGCLGFKVCKNIKRSFAGNTVMVRSSDKFAEPRFKLVFIQKQLRRCSATST